MKNMRTFCLSISSLLCSLFVMACDSPGVIPDADRSYRSCSAPMIFDMNPKTFGPNGGEFTVALKKPILPTQFVSVEFETMGGVSTGRIRMGRVLSSSDPRDGDRVFSYDLRFGIGDAVPLHNLQEGSKLKAKIYIPSPCSDDPDVDQKMKTPTMTREIPIDFQYVALSE